MIRKIEWKMKTHRSGLFILILFSVKMKNIFNAETGESSSTMTGRMRRYENINKRSNDTRSYRGLQLDNDLRILLISDQNLTEAAATMAINVGHLNDFDELPGSTHFVGESLNRFGSQTYPEQTFAEVIQSRLSANILDFVDFPTTDDDKQRFFFEINANFLAPALEIFARFFNEPSLMISNSRNPLDTCIQNVDWFNSSAFLDEQNNRWRLRQLEKSISADDHPFNRSPYGNPETFRQYLAEEKISNESERLSNGESCQTILHDKLRKFFSIWYSSNVMCLVVLGKESLDELERLTVPLFEKIPNKRVERLTFTYEQHPWGQEQLRRKIYTAFDDRLINDSTLEVLWLVFRVPDFRHEYKTSPELYVRNVLERGGPGSLISVLRKRKLCFYIKPKYDVKAGIGFFDIKCGIDDEIHEDEVVGLIIQYIRLLNADGIHEWIFKEHSQLDEIRYARIHTHDHIPALASAMHDYPMEDILSYKYPNEWKPSLIKEFLSYLVPENMNVFIDSKKYQNSIEDQNKWHKIPYKTKMISDQLIEKWKTEKISQDFQAPQPNEFLVENFTIHPLNENEPENLYVVYESHRSRFWFFQDNRDAYARVTFDFIDLKAYLDLSTSTFFCIFSETLNHILADFSYALQMSEYEWSITFGENFINIHLYGYSDKMETVVRMIMSKITADHLAGSHSWERFKKTKEDCLRRRKNHVGRFSVVYNLKYLLTETAKSSPNDEITIASELLQFEDWKKFINKMLSHAFVQGLITGNYKKQAAVSLAKIIEGSFGMSARLIPQEMLGLLPRVLEMEGGKHYVHITIKDTDEKIRPHYTLYQFGTTTVQNSTISSLLISMIGRKCVGVFRNDFMTQYGIFKVYSMIGLLVWTVRAQPADQINSQFENCLRIIHVSLQEMTDFEFETYVKAEIDKRLTEDYSNIRLWENISRGVYSFDEDVDVNFSSLLTKTDVLTFFEDMLYEHSPKRRKLTVLFFPKNSDWSSSSYLPRVTTIWDVISFKNSSSFLPLPSQFTKLNFIYRERMRT